MHVFRLLWSKSGVYQRSSKCVALPAGILYVPNWNGKLRGYVSCMTMCVKMKGFNAALNAAAKNFPLTRGKCSSDLTIILTLGTATAFPVSLLRHSLLFSLTSIDRRARFVCLPLRNNCETSRARWHGLLPFNTGYILCGLLWQYSRYDQRLGIYWLASNTGVSWTVLKIFLESPPTLSPKDRWTFALRGWIARRYPWWRCADTASRGSWAYPHHHLSAVHILFGIICPTHRSSKSWFLDTRSYHVNAYFPSLSCWSC